MNTDELGFKLLDLPAEKIRLGGTVLGDAQLRLQRDPTAL